MISFWKTLILDVSVMLDFLGMVTLVRILMSALMILPSVQMEHA